MSNHLPECSLGYKCHGLMGIAGNHAMKMDYCTACRRVCICPELRSCEQRVLGDRDEIVGITAVRSFRAGLDAAEAAVAELAKETFCDSAPCWGAERYVAAIRALKEKP